MQLIQQLRQWFYSLPLKEQRLVLGTAVIIVLTLFYVTIWEPIHQGLNDELQKQQSQQQILLWMQQAAMEAKSLQASGGSVNIRERDKPVTLVIEQSIKNAGLKPAATKIESSGNDAARITFNEASFNQILVWLNTIATHNGIQVVSANIERASGPGRANVRLTLERP